MRIGRHEKEKRQGRRRKQGKREEEGERRGGEETRRGKHCLDMCNIFWSTWYAVHV